MGKAIIQYDAMWGEALRGIVRQALRASENGLPGGHHFYITFRTRHPTVEMSDTLRARFPDEMTIVLQHQYWGLEITEDWFEVTLSFNRLNERLHVPFAAVSAFADPFAKFGIQIPTDASIELPSEEADRRTAHAGRRQKSPPRPRPRAKPAASSRWTLSERNNHELRRHSLRRDFSAGRGRHPLYQADRRPCRHRHVQRPARC